MLIHMQRNESSVDQSSAANNTSGEYSGNKLVAISIIFVILNTIFITLRCYARSLTKAVYGWDDYLVFAGFVSNTALSVVSIRTHHYFIITSAFLQDGINSLQAEN
jgi:hypothetical protein